MHVVETNLFCPVKDKKKLRAALNLPSGLLIGCFGRVSHQKGVDVLVDAVLKILPQNPDISIVFTGRITRDNEEFANTLRAKLERAGLLDRVLFRGEVDWADLVKYFQSLDLFVAPARREGFGLTPLEAMSCGVLAIATKVGAFDSQIVEGKTGLLIPAGNVQALADAIEQMTMNSERLAIAGIASREHVVASFPIQGGANGLVNVYRELLGTKA